MPAVSSPITRAGPRCSIVPSTWAIAISTARLSPQPARRDWPFWLGWTPTARAHPSISSIQIGSRSTLRDVPTAPKIATLPASTAVTTRSSCPRSCVRSSSAATRMESPTIAGAAWSGHVSATASIARASSATRWACSCLWIGMNGGDLIAQSNRFRDYKAICERAEIIMLDSQARTQLGGFQSNAEMGKLIHGLLGWDKLIPESMAMYQAGRPTFRVASKPEPEARLWVLEGFAGTIQPWWHHIGAYHEDRRQYRTAESLFRWHEEHEQYLVDRRPVAPVGIVWTRENVDFYGRDAAEERVQLPHVGVREALIRARIPFLPIHADHVDRAGDELMLLVLPNLGALSDAQCAGIRRFVGRGGGLVATGR